jgi:hypothetical protein
MDPVVGPDPLTGLSIHSSNCDVTFRLFEKTYVTTAVDAASATYRVHRNTVGEVQANLLHP